MTRINLLPPEKIKVKRAPTERSYLWLVIVLPLVVLVAFGAWFFSVNSQIAEKDRALEAAQTELANWQAKNAQLQQYKKRQEEIAALEQTVVNALSGRVYWARILNEIAIMCPGDVWLTSLSGSASGGAGSVQFQGYALQCWNRALGGTFWWYPDYRPIAGWLERMAQIAEFDRLWLGSAEPTRVGTAPTVRPDGEQTTGHWVISFSSNATLDMEEAAVGGLRQAAPEAPPAPTPQGDGGDAE